MDYEEIDVQKLITDMTEALQEAHEVQEQYAAKLDELEKENLSLSETITQNCFLTTLTATLQLYLQQK